MIRVNNHININRDSYIQHIPLNYPMAINDRHVEASLSVHGEGYKWLFSVCAWYNYYFRFSTYFNEFLIIIAVVGLFI